MRLFIAITFEEEIKKMLAEFGGRLEAAGIKGRFSAEENIHLTLAFLGESRREAELCRILGSLEGAAFPLESGVLGRFRKQGGDVLWLGLKKSQALGALYGQLVEKLAGAGFALEERPYQPHITLGRQVCFPSESLFYEFQKNGPWFRTEAAGNRPGLCRPG